MRACNHGLRLQENGWMKAHNHGLRQTLAQSSSRLRERRRCTQRWPDRATRSMQHIWVLSGFGRCWACSVLQLLTAAGPHLAAGAAGQAGYHHVDRLRKTHAAERLHVLHVPKAHLRARKLLHAQTHQCLLSVPVIDQHVSPARGLPKQHGGGMCMDMHIACMQRGRRGRWMQSTPFPCHPSSACRRCRSAPARMRPH